MPDALLGGFHVFRVDQPGKGVAGQGLKFLQVFAAVYLEKSPIGVDQAFLLIGVIDEETAGHPCGDLLDDGKGLLAQAQRAPFFWLMFAHRS